jgi:hypothetical protein
MKQLRKFGAAIVLTFVLALSAFAGEILTSPCAPPEPGQVETPPCGAAPGDMGTFISAAPGDIGTSTVANDESLFSKIATDLFLNILPLF